MDIAWNEKGLAPAVAQHAITGEVLMLAWMNEEAFKLTTETGLAHFFSRSRNKLWKKGETSGNLLSVVEVRTDCDRDAILMSVVPNGPACHTGADSCFFRPVGAESDQGPPGSILEKLERVLLLRSESNSEKSYTKSLLDGGITKIISKIVEEQKELTDELPAGNDQKVVHEAADLLFHVMVAFCSRQIRFSNVLTTLAQRFGVSGHDEKKSRG